MKNIIALLGCLTLSYALPTFNKRKVDNYDQVMLSPRMSEDMYGPNYVWDTKGMPRKIEEETPRQYYDSAPIHVSGAENDDFMPVVLQNAMYLLKNHVSTDNYRVHFPDSPMNFVAAKTTRKPHSTDDIEQRMMLPEGMEIPDEMYGPNYAWDTKGWPSRVNPNDRNNVPQDSPVYFPQNDS